MSRLLQSLARKYSLALGADERFDLPPPARPLQHKTALAEALEARGYETWLRTLGPHTFTGSFARFHHQMWSWYWMITMKRLRGEPLTDEELAFLAIWFRSGGKSAHAEWAAIAEGALLGYGFVLYLCNTEAQAEEHVASIRARLESPLIAEHYPGLANPQIGKHGYQVAWRQDYLATASGWGIIPAGLDKGIRGGRKNDLRFTLMIFDDFDNLNESPAVVEKNLNTLARSILPAGQRDTVVLIAQNLIREDSGLNQIYTRRSDVLSERIVSGPVPAFNPDTLKLRLRDEGSRVWTIEHAEPTWPDIDMTAARRFLARSGRVAFLAEYQHDFEGDKSEYVLQHWRDDIHVITWSEFARVYGVRSIPPRWFKYVAHDYARTKSAYHANVALALAVSAQHEPLPGYIFMYQPMSFPAGTEADEVARRLLNLIAPAVPVGGTQRPWDDLIAASLKRAPLDQYITDATRLMQARREVLARVLPRYVQPQLGAQRFMKWRMSHERDDLRRVYRDVYGLPFAGVNPGLEGGIDWLNHYIHVDESAPHPFKPGVMGCSRFYLIVDDEKAEYPADLTPDGLHDSDLARYQLRRWRLRPAKMNEAGIVERGPLKLNDDFGQALQMLFYDNCIQAAPLTKDERVWAEMPAHVRPEAIAQVTDPHERTRLLTAQMMQRRAIEAKTERPRNRSATTAWRDMGKEGR
jgi:hypothetical protein